MTTTDDDPRVFNPWKSDDEEGFDPKFPEGSWVQARTGKGVPEKGTKKGQKAPKEATEGENGQKEPKEKRAKEERPESQIEAEIDPFGL